MGADDNRNGLRPAQGTSYQGLSPDEQELLAEGKCKAIGLSDVNLEQLRGIVETARTKPSVVQVEAHPYLPQWELLDYCKKNDIVLVAFAALGHNGDPRLLSDAVVTSIANRLGRTPAQVVLAWAVQRGTYLLTTSKNPNRIKENFDLSAIHRRKRTRNITKQSHSQSIGGTSGRGGRTP